MRNVLILGSGRSGTSMAAGVLSQAGYFMGEQLQEIDEGNPKGYFEDLEINSINEDILAQVTPTRPDGIIGNLFFRSRLPHWQRWLARIPVGTPIPCPNHVTARIQAMTAHAPFCFKDPRFAYTLSAWRQFLKNVVFVCVFRHPAVTAVSIVNEAKRVSVYWKLHLHITYKHALQIWELMYRHILEVHYSRGGNWLFLHYDQFLTGIALDTLEKKLEVTVHREFVNRQLNRSTSTLSIPPRILSLYHRLKEYAGYCNEKK